MNSALNIADAPAARPGLYALINAGFSLLTIVASLAGPGSNPRAAYLCLLMAICTTPLLWMRKVNGRYVLLCAFLAAYLFFYGANDFAALFASRVSSLSTGMLSAAELAILGGGLMTVLGYHVALAAHARAQSPRPSHDYPISLVIVAGLALWVIGTAATWMWQVKYQTTAIQMSKDFDTFSILAMVLGRMLQPLGTIMLAYALILTRSRWLLLLIIATALLQVVVGFIGDSKETAMRSALILVIAGFLLEGRISKGWVVALVAFAVLIFPIFEAYRAEVMHVRGMSRAQAASDITRSLELALGARQKVKRNLNDDYKSPGFLQRSALKPTMELFIARTGTDAPFQKGYTLGLFFTSFVPRALWPDKPDNSTGQLMNRQFHVSEDRDTYISATHLGEFYWNFGYPGIVVGMFCIGYLLGFINARCDLSERRTLTRLLILITTIYATVVRFEGNIALEYTLFVRSLFIIWLLHMMFARVTVKSGAARELPARPPPLIHAPQLLR